MHHQADTKDANKDFAGNRKGYQGHKGMEMKKILLILMICLVAALSLAQAPKPDTPKVVPIVEEPSHHLVLENEYVRVFQVEVPPHSETKYHQHDRDYIFVTLGDSVVESTRLNEKPVKLELKDGETRFTKGRFAHKAVNLSDKPFRNVTVEFKNKAADAKVENYSFGFGLANVTGVVSSKAYRCLGHPNRKNNGTGLPAGRPIIVIVVSPLEIRENWGESQGRDNKKMNTGEIMWFNRTNQYQLFAGSFENESNFVVCEFLPGNNGRIIH